MSAGPEASTPHDVQHQRELAAFIDSWVRRSVRRYRVTPAQLDELRAAGRLGGVKGLQRWLALSEEERTDKRRRIIVARLVKDEVFSAWRAMQKDARVRDAVTTFVCTEGAHDLRQRFEDMRAHLRREAYASLLSGELRPDSPEDLYLEQEQLEQDRDRVHFALARLDTADERTLARLYLLERRSLTEACAAIGIHDKSARTRARQHLFRMLRRHATTFASQQSRRPPPSDGDSS